MRNLLHIVIAAAISLLAGACGHSDSFVVKGSLSNGASMNLRIIYYTDSKVFTGVTAATDGGFAFEGTAPSDALVEIYDNEYRLLGRVVARNGDDIEIVADPTGKTPFSAKGNPSTELWSKFIADNHGTAATARNKAVESFVKGHRDNPLSALLVMTEFDARGEAASLADSLMTIISPEARQNDITAGFNAILNRVNSATSHAPVAAIPYMVSGNRTELFRPRKARVSLIGISDGQTSDSVRNLFRELSGSGKDNRPALLDLSADPDTTAWSRQLRADSVKWTAGWVAGSISGTALNRLGIPTLPFFIVTDSAGSQLWRGTSAAGAKAFLDQAYRK